MLLAITALSTTFFGLLAILLLYGYRRKDVSHGDHARTLRQWLTHHNISLPSTAAVISAINKKAKEEILRPTASGEELKQLRVERLLPNTPLPVFTVLKLSSQSTDTMSIECSVEWPECAPGILVSAVKEKQTKHCVQVEIMKMKAAVELSIVDDQLMVSWQLLQRPELELMCNITEEEDDSMSDSVADAVSMLLTQFSMVRQRLTEEEEEEDEPTNLRSTKEEEEEEVKEEEEGEEGSNVGEKVDEDLKVEVEEQDLIEVVQIRETIEVTEVVAEKKKEEEEEEKENGSRSSSTEHLLVPTKFVPTSSSMISNGTVCEDGSSGHTSSAIAVHENNSDHLTNSWRRSPSYECLQEIGIDNEPPAVTQRVALSHSHDNLSDNDSEKERLSTLSIRSYESILEDTIGSTPSTLVFEIQDGHHVLHKVATNIEQARQLRKQYPKSKKLHLYLSHTYVAVHINRRQNCAVCKEKIAGLLGKQAYRCRDCHISAHKQCHYKVETTCTHSKVSSMNLIYPDGD